MFAPAILDTAADALTAARTRGFLGRLPADLLDDIAGRAVLIHHPSGSMGLPARGGRPAVVVTGLVRNYVSAPDGRQLTIGYAGAGDLLVPVLSTVSGLCTGFQAIEASSLLHLDRTGLRSTAARHPELALALLEELSHQLRRAYGALAVGTFATVRSRVARDLVERARAVGDLRPGARLRVTQQELADATGSVREVVTRSLRDLRQLGLVVTDHSHVVILDIRGLARAAGVSVVIRPKAD